MGLFVCLWVVVSIFSAFCPLRVAYRLQVCCFSIFAGFVPFLRASWLQILTGTPPRCESVKSGLPFRKIFFEKYFFYFCICNRGLQASRSRFVFCWLFSCKRPKIAYFLDVIVEIGWGNVKFGYFLAFLDAFASWMRVCLSLVKKVSKIGLFWLSLFFSLFAIGLFWLSSYGKVYTFGYDIKVVCFY